MDTAIATVLATLGANALVLGALTYLINAFITNRLEREMAAFRNAIERKAAHEIETYRAQLEKDRIRMQISYGGIFEKQAEAILAMHTAVVELEIATNQAIHMGGDVAERKKAFLKPWHELRRAYQFKRILLPPVIDEAVSSFADNVMHGVLDYMSVESRDFTRVSDKEFEKLSEKQGKAMEVINKEVPKLREKLISEMRKVIGVVTSEF